MIATQYTDSVVSGNISLVSVQSIDSNGLGVFLVFLCCDESKAFSARG